MPTIAHVYFETSVPVTTADHLCWSGVAYQLAQEAAPAHSKLLTPWRLPSRRCVYGSIRAPPSPLPGPLPPFVVSLLLENRIVTQLRPLMASCMSGMPPPCSRLSVFTPPVVARYDPIHAVKLGQQIARNQTYGLDGSPSCRISVSARHKMAPLNRALEGTQWCIGRNRLPARGPGQRRIRDGFRREGEGAQGKATGPNTGEYR